jgi:hypothetical protein
MKLKLLILLLVSTSQLYAQNIITEGKLFYDISYQNLNADMLRNEHMLPHDASFYFKNEKTRMEMGVAGAGKNSTIYDGGKKQSTILLNIYGKKFALIKSDSEMVEVKKSMSNDTTQKVLRVEILDEFKKIADKNCQKALIHRIAFGKSQISECWFTKEIKPYNTQTDENLKAINGFLMQYQMTENGMTMTMTVKMIMQLPIDDKMFSIPEGYQLVTEEELNKLLMVMQNNPLGN